MTAAMVPVVVAVVVERFSREAALHSVAEEQILKGKARAADLAKLAVYHTIQ